MSDMYEVAFTSAAIATTTGGANIAEIAQPGAGTTPRMKISEIDVFFNTPTTGGTSIVFGLGRPGNTPTSTAPIVGVADDPASPAAFGGYTTAWTTAPTVPAKFLRQAAIAGAVGNGVIWTWPIGDELVVPPNNRANSVILWMTQSTAVTSSTWTVTVRWSE